MAPKIPTQQEIEAMAREFVEAYGISYDEALALLNNYVQDTIKELNLVTE